MDKHETGLAAELSNVLAPLAVSETQSTAGYRDATIQLRAACSALEPGQMVAVPDFTLMDSMAAIKIMDVRMDSGMDLPPSELPESDRLSEFNVEIEFDPLRQLDMTDVLWIMDRLLASEAAWYQGSALSQTVFTCMYVHNIKYLSHKNPRFQAKVGGDASQPPELIFKVLRSFVLGTLKTVDLIWTELAIKQHVNDGEDYSSEKSGLSLLESTDPGYVISQIDDALLWLENIIAQRSSSSAAQSLQARLSFRKHFLRVVSLMPGFDQAFSLDVVMHSKFARRSLASLRPDYTTEKEFSTAPPMHEVLQQPGRRSAPSSAASCAFDPAYNRKLMSNTPLKAITLPQAETTWGLFDGILADLQEIMHVVHHPSFESWKTFFAHRSMEYQRSQGLSSTPYVRSLRQTAVCDRNMIAGRLPLEWLAEAFFQEVASIEPSLLRRATCIGCDNVEGGSQMRWNAPPSLGQQFKFFIQRLAGNLVSFLTTYCQNRARTKRQFGSHLYREFVMLAEEASELGRKLERQPGFTKEYVPDTLYAAIQHLTLEIMAQITYSGFELDLYADGTDRESMWWLGSRIQQEQHLVCTDLVRELNKKLGSTAAPPSQRATSTIAYLTQQTRLAAALEQLSISTLYLLKLFPSAADQRRQARGGWPLEVGQNSESSAQLAISVFATRAKWMRIPSRASNFETQVESLWSEYLAFARDMQQRPREELITAAKDALTCAASHLQRSLDELTAQLRNDITNKDATLFLESLLASTHQNLDCLQQQTSPSSSIWKFDNQWIPTLSLTS